VPVDVVLVKYDGQTLRVDESSVTGESDLIEKCTVEELKTGKNKTAEDKLKFCMLISGSTVNEGTAYG
jgi:magnesium-transporting ATPase (P-type)